MAANTRNDMDQPRNKVQSAERQASVESVTPSVPPPIPNAARRARTPAGARTGGHSTSGPAVEIDELTKKYGDFTALDRLALTGRRGQIRGLVGPNGAVKTTTIKILVGLARPTSGSARVAGTDCVAEARKLKRLVGYMPDTFGSYDNMRVGEYLDFFGAAFGIPRRER